ncbi:hypothetical protein B0T21DRAFT_397886 [Apiosordaria backusii]|uniref:Uncharacterized protein n=1 Tax=Apiosordaria backusii TaxID=314023 RepID=A0AA40EXW4_9PEZI|nr:hypothetical protein B0T21DRAFT_397886 [Apiosordaria backusii]
MPDSENDQTEPAEADRLALEDRMEEALTLLDIAFHKLIGVKKSTPGVKVTKKNNELPSLIDIAPAKVESMMPGYIDPEMWDLEEEIEGEVRKQLWLRCQTGIRADPIKKNNTTQAKLEEASQEDTPQSQLDGREFAWENYGPLGCEDALIRHSLSNPDYYLPTMNQTTDYYDVPEGNYDHDDDEYYEDDSSSDTDSLPGCSSADVEPIPSDDWLGSSEGDYFYTDGFGNVVSLPQDSDTGEPEGVDWDRSSSVDTMDFEHDTD